MDLRLESKAPQTPKSRSGRPAGRVDSGLALRYPYDSFIF